MDEPSNAELAWRLEAIQRQLAELVGRPEYQARLESAERRFGELGTDVVHLGTRIDEHEHSHATSSLSWRAIIYTAIPSALMVLVGIAVQIWLSGRS